MRRVRGPVAVGLAALLAACAHGLAAHPGSGTYVALGSSFAAGTAMGGIKPGTPERCQRSPLNYATVLAGRLGLPLVDASCGGALTAHVVAAWNELPAQVAAVGPDARLVTITIGGNDVGYIRNLFAGSCDGTASRPSSAPPCPTRQDPSEADWAAMEQGLRQIVGTVRAQAPRARIVLVDYITLLPATGTCAALRLTADEADRARAVARRLATATARIAQETGVDLLPASALSAAHSACDAQPWSVAAPGSPIPDGGAPWHPNAAGHAAVADALERLLAERH